MESISLKCIKPTKTLIKDKLYICDPVKKDKADGSYNGQWTTSWMYCSLDECTSFKVQDSLDIIRYVSKKRFKL